MAEHHHSGPPDASGATLRPARPPTGAPVHGYSATDGALIALVFAAALPFATVRLTGMGADSPAVVATTAGVAIVAAAFALSWATEALETVLPVSVAIALLALIEVAPEYSFEVILAYRQQTELAAASMTGANRLLLGAGWPLLALVAWSASRRQRRPFDGILLGRDQVVVLRALLLATLYSFVIVLKASISLLDAIVLAAIYLGSIYVGLRSNPEDEEEEGHGGVGVGARTKTLPTARKALAIGAFLVYGALVLFFAAEPFINSVLEVAGAIGVSSFVLIQWLAPFLSEFPESLTAYLWAATIIEAPKGLSNLISSKLNQWTLLIATIPIAYSVGLGRVAALPLSARSVEELFLTAGQTLFAAALIVRLRFGLREAGALFALFAVQFVVTSQSVRLVLGWVYIALAAMLFVVHWRALLALIGVRSADPRLR